MAIIVPKPGGTHVPQVPDGIRRVNPELYEYLKKLVRYVNDMNEGFFQNNSVVASAINSGTSGSLLIASGGHINVTSGIITSVSTT